MSAAACKTILCGWDALFAIVSFIADHQNPGNALKKAATLAQNGIHAAMEITKLLVTQAAGGTVREITWPDAHDVIEEIEAFEHGLTPQLPPAEAKTFMELHTEALRKAVQKLHDKVTGEKTEY